MPPPDSFLIPIMLMSRSSSKSCTASTTIAEKNSLWLAMSLEFMAVPAHLSKYSRILLKRVSKKRNDVKADLRFIFDLNVDRQLLDLVLCLNQCQTFALHILSRMNIPIRKRFYKRGWWPEGAHLPQRRAWPLSTTPQRAALHLLYHRQPAINMSKRAS